MRKLIIGDIHGCNKTFEALLDKVHFSTFDHLYLLGDYVDRGPDSKGVFDTIFKLKDEGYQVTCLRGNHEQMMLDAFSNDYEDSLAFWMQNGGKQTMDSFYLKDGKTIPSTDENPLQQYLTFCNLLPYCVKVDDLILVHASLNFKKIDPMKDMESMMWMRDWYNHIDYDWLENRTIVHGHTPLSRRKIEILFDKREELRVINLDCGAVFSLKGRQDCYLCCMDWTNEKLYFQEQIDEF